MNILFIGNSLLIPYYNIYENKNFTDDLGNRYSFAIDIGGWGPCISILNDRLVPSTRNDKDKYPDIFYPANLLEISVSSFDVICLVAVGYIGCGLDYSSWDFATYGLIHDFNPKENELTNKILSKNEAYELVSCFLDKQPGFNLITTLSHLLSSTKVIVIEMPYFSEKIIDQPNWLLSKLYENPSDAYKFFSKIRNSILTIKCNEAGAFLIQSPFSEDTFTPSRYIDSKDFFHTNDSYANLQIDKINDLLVQF